MTINKKLGFSLVAAAMLSTSAMAANNPCILTNGVESGLCDGTVTVGQTGNGTISAELLAVSEVNASVANFSFLPHFTQPSIRNNPVFEFAITPSSVSGDLSGHAIYEVIDNNGSLEYNTSRQITETGTIANGVISFAVLSSGGGAVKSESRYAILSISGDGNASNSANFAQNVNVLIKTAADAANTSVCANVYTGDTGAHLSGDCKSPLYTVVNEYKIVVDKVFDRRIALCSSNGAIRTAFDTTSGGCGADDNKSDSATFQIIRTDVTYPFVDNNMSDMMIHADTNLTVVNNVDAANSTLLPVFTAKDFNVTGASDSYQSTVIESASLAGTKTAANQDLTVVYDVNLTGKIPDTKFDWEFTLRHPNGKTTGALGSDSKGKLGEWKPFGYAAQIPNVTTNTAKNLSTNIIVTNTGDKVAEVFFTLVSGGKECTINSVDSAAVVPAIPANSVTVYSATDLLANCATPAPLPTSTTKFGLEIDIATTPTNIYTAASFRNSTTSTKVFKDLPVYNTSSMSY